jgi:hypothetical protein
MRRLPLVVGALAVVACSCSGDDGEASDLPTSSVTLEGVGDVPATLTPDVLADVATTVPAPETTAPLDTTPPSSTTDNAVVAGSIPPSTTAEPTSLEGVGTIGQVADGNRVLVIGDSLMASTAIRYGGLMCQQLVPLGWSVAVEAETGQQVNFGLEVLDSRQWEGWNVAVVMLGNNFSTDQLTFEIELTQIVDRLSPMPILLFTVTEFQPSRVQVNDTIRRVAALRQNVRVADWASVTAFDDGLLSGDGLHLSEAGRARLVGAVVENLGLAPPGNTGECLTSNFIDDNRS